MSKTIKIKKFNIEEMRQKTLEARQNNQMDFKKAYDLAFEKVIEGSEEKINDAVSNGKFRAYLYLWQYVADKSDRRYTFNNIRMLDIVTKGDLIDRLKEHFNPTDEESTEETGIYVGWHKLKNNGKDAKISKYGIYISWAEKTDDDNSQEETSTPSDETSKETMSKDAKSKEVASKDVKSKDVKSKDAKSNDVKSKDVKSKDVKSNDVASKDAISKDIKSNGNVPKKEQTKVLKSTKKLSSNEFLKDIDNINSDGI